MKKHHEIPLRNQGFIRVCPFLYLIFIFHTPVCTQEITHFITPRRTDERLAGGQPPHFIALHRDVERRNTLFLFLPGTGNTPEAYRSIARLAAINGFHAVNLSYPNALSVNFTCTDERSLTCHANMRSEIIWGTDCSDKIQVDSINCIRSRLVKLLEYLIEYFPHDGWNIYLDKKHLPVWSRIIVAGHSQGGGHAGFIGKKRTTAGVIMFSSADYCNTYNKPAPWLSTNGLTPSSRYSVLGHMRDRTFPLSLQLKAWRALKLTVIKPVVNVDTVGYPYKHAQVLISDAPPSRERPCETPFHNAVVVDYDTPKKADGSMVFKDVWRYLLLRRK